MSTQSRSRTVVLIRHAQSEWNAEGRFTGWADPSLTLAGRREAERAGTLLAGSGFRFDRAFTSGLLRATDTARLVLDHSGHGAVRIETDWRLNERHYGALQGKDKAEMTARVGADQVWRWRRGYLDRPPAMAETDPAHPARDPRWRAVPRGQLPNGESLAQTRERVMAFWRERVRPRVEAGERLLIASHGNTLRALLMSLDGMGETEVEGFEVPTGVPIVYRLAGNGRAIGWRYLDVDIGQAA